MEAYILDAVYTPRASVKKGLSVYSGVHPQELVAACLRTLRERQAPIFAALSSAYVGCVSQVGEQGANLARNAVLAAGLPENVSAASLNMCCGSGLQSVNLAAFSVAAGAESLVIGGGVESMSRVKMASDGGGMDGGNTALRSRYLQVPQGISADWIAALEGIDRTALDTFAAESHARAAAARGEGLFAPSYAFVSDNSTNNQPMLLAEDHIRADTTGEGLAQLRPAFGALAEELTAQGVIGDGPDSHIPITAHLHTAGNSSGIADGAGLVLLASAQFVGERALKPRAKIVATAARGSDPLTMLTGPADCVNVALQKAGLKIDDIDLWEINEAFAVVPLQTMRRLKIDAAKVNIWGGAIALGHPLGATGAILLTTLLTALEHRAQRIGCAVLCVAGGQSVATIIERL